MPAILFRRDDDGLHPEVEEPSSDYTPTVANLVTSLVALMLAGLVLTAGLFYVRYRRRRAATLAMRDALEGNHSPNGPMAEQQMLHKNMGLRAPANPGHHRRTKSLTTPPDSPMFVVGDAESHFDEKRIEAGKDGAVHVYGASPAGGLRRESVPQIHLTFPEEVNEKTGRRESKVVVVTVSDKGAVGLSPFAEEAPPQYCERDDMKSLDLQRIGGLKEVKA